MYKYAGYAQQLLLRDSGHQFRHIIIVDVASMLLDTEGKNTSSLHDLLVKENESKEVVKGFGKTLLRTFQRLSFNNVVLAS